MNATGTSIGSTQTNAFYVAPIRQVTPALSTLMYNSATTEIVYSSSKTFVIDHPTDENKYLVHACLEGPEAGVYYRGKGEIENNESVTILLPDYADSLADDFTIQITPIFNGSTLQTYNVGEIENNQFSVYGANGKFFWIVHGKRDSIDVEPLKSKTSIKGYGPYKWIYPL